MRRPLPVATTIHRRPRPQRQPDHAKNLPAGVRPAVPLAPCALLRAVGQTGGSCSALSKSLTIRRRSVVSLRATPRWRALVRAAASRPPCFHDEILHRASPSAVRAPVLPPPCILHRPLSIAAPRQLRPVRLHVAPHRWLALARSRSSRHRGVTLGAQASPCIPAAFTGSARAWSRCRRPLRGLRPPP